MVRRLHSFWKAGYLFMCSAETQGGSSTFPTGSPMASSRLCMVLNSNCASWSSLSGSLPANGESQSYRLCIATKAQAYTMIMTREIWWNIDWKLFRIVYNCFKIVSKCSTKNQQTIAKPFLRKWFVEILQLIDIILKTDQFSPQMVCRDFATCICKYIHIWIQLQKTDQLSPQMVCRDFCCKCLCQTIVKQLSNYFTAILVFSNYCQNNCSNFWTIVKTIS